MTENRTFSISEIITALIALSFILTVSYEHGYFCKLGLELTGLISTDDVFASAVYWLPFPIAGFCVSFLFLLIEERLGWRKPEDVYEHSTSKIFGVFAIFFSIIFLCALLYQWQLTPLLMLILAFFYSFVCWILEPYRLTKRQLLILSLLFSSPALSWFWGVDNAQTSISSINKPLVIVGDKTYKMLRKLQNGVLLYDDNTRFITFIKNENLQRITYHNITIK